MPVPEVTNTHTSSKMATNKRQKTGDEKTPLPSEPSDRAKLLALSSARGPDINEYQVNIDADLDSKPPLQTPLSDEELPPRPAHHTKKKNKKKET
ncbi:hypothetical protein ACF0H5_021091 [Mactra antiquata]